MTEESPVPMGMRILVIVSRPLDLPDLPNMADQWALQSGLRRVHAPAFMKMLRPPTVEGLRAEILNGYDIVHFDGHGGFGRRCPNCGGFNGLEQKKCWRCDALLEDEAARGFFALEREDGLLDALAADELADIVMSVPETAAKLVILSCNESAKRTETSLLKILLDKGVPAVLGMNGPVSLKASMSLAAPFYAGLGIGMSIAQAFENALPALKVMENAGKLLKIPVLDGPGKDVRILPARVAGRVTFDAERLFGLPEYEFVGDYIRGDPPRGRKGILFQVMNALLEGEKMVVLSGQGGIGKTVLAAEAARRLAWRYPGGVFWRSASGGEHLGLEEMLNAFDNVYGLEFRKLPLDKKRDTVLNYLRNYDTASLLVIDSAEYIQGLDVWSFLESIPMPSVALVTTRESLFREGREIRVPEMEPEEAGRLLLTEARRRSLRWGENLNPEDRQSLSEIARLMQGHPLAIKLTAALIASKSLASIIDELKINPPQEVLERFDFSYRNLSEGQRELFSRLAAFSGSMTEEAIKSICIEEEKDDRSNWKNDLHELVRRSFLEMIEVVDQKETGEIIYHYRYRLHPIMRQYAAKKAIDLMQKFGSRAATYFLEYAMKFKQNFDMLEREKENILSSMDWAFASQRSADEVDRTGFSQMILEFMSALESFLDTKGYWNELGLRLQQAIEAAEILEDKRRRSLWIHYLGILSQKMGNFDEARKHYQTSLMIFHDLGDKSGISTSLHNLGALAQNSGDYSEALELYHQSLKLDQELNDKRGVSQSLHQLGTLAQMKGDYDKALEFYQQSLEIDQELGDKRGVSRSLHQLGILAQIQRDYQKARMFYNNSLNIFQELGDRSGISSSLHNLGILAQATGDYNEAKTLYQHSLQIDKELGDKGGVSRSLHQLGILAQVTGDYDEAERLFQQSLDILKNIGDKLGIARSLYQLGILAKASGDYDEARNLFQQSLVIDRELGDKNGIRNSLFNLGKLGQADSSYIEAKQIIHQRKDLEKKLETEKRGYQLVFDKDNENQTSYFYKFINEFHDISQDSRLIVKEKEIDISSIKLIDTLEKENEFELSQRLPLHLTSREVDDRYNKARNLMDRKDWKMARSLLDETKNLYKMQNNQKGFAKTLLAIAQVEEAMGELERARWTYKDALHQFLDVDMLAYAVTLLFLGKLELLTGFTLDAKKHLERAEEYFIDYQDKSYLLKIRKLLEIIDQHAS